MKIEDLTLKDDGYELKPIDNRKSFYGKCSIYNVQDNVAWYDDPGIDVLKSYDTYVCAVGYFDVWEPDFYRLWEGYSSTTLRHVNAFRNAFGMSILSKSEWEALPVFEPVMTDKGVVLKEKEND